jgi:hypothetical protein
MTRSRAAATNSLPILPRERQRDAQRGSTERQRKKVKGTPKTPRDQLLPPPQADREAERESDTERDTEELAMDSDDFGDEDETSVLEVLKHARTHARMHHLHTLAHACTRTHTLPLARAL